jgi:hypothetical protein
MAESTVRRPSIVEQLLRPQHEPEVTDAIEASQDARSRSRDAVMLDLRLSDGTIESFAYMYLARVRFVPGDVIELRFGKEDVRITGRNLTRLRETLAEHRTRFVQEGAEGEDGLKAPDAVHVDQIEIVEREEA